MAKHVLRNVYLYNLENGLPPEIIDAYDAVICSHVLEHICYPQQLMKDIHRVLKVNGTLIVALPNIMHYKSRLQLEIGNFNYTNAGLWDDTHFRWYTFKTAIDLLKQHQFSIDTATATGELSFNYIFNKILPAAIRNRLYAMLIKISKGFFGYQLIYRAIKATPTKSGF